MATVLEVIQSAYRRSGVIGAGVIIDATKKDVGLELLQGLYRDLANGTLGQLTDKYLTTATAYTAQEFERVFNTAGAVITMPATVRDVVATNNPMRPPVDGCVIQVVVPGIEPVTRIYDPSRAEWQQIEGLVLTAVAPLSSRFDNHLRNLLAIYIADDVGTPIGPVLVKRAGAAKLAFASRYGSKRLVTPIEFY